MVVSTYEAGVTLTQKCLDGDWLGGHVLWIPRVAVSSRTDHVQYTLNL